jgi:hypothetical protein
LISNPTRLAAGSLEQATDLARSSCYSDADRVVVGEFIRYLVDGMKAQYYDIGGVTQFLAPVYIDDSYAVAAGCTSEATFFKWNTDVAALEAQIGTSYPEAGVGSSQVSQ